MATDRRGNGERPYQVPYAVTTRENRGMPVKRHAWNALQKRLQRLEERLDELAARLNMLQAAGQAAMERLDALEAALPPGPGL
jgi:ActR/RegA family two-component response regulator